MKKQILELLTNAGGAGLVGVAVGLLCALTAGAWFAYEDSQRSGTSYLAEWWSTIGGLSLGFGAIGLIAGVLGTLGVLR